MKFSTKATFHLLLASSIQSIFTNALVCTPVTSKCPSKPAFITRNPTSSSPFLSCSISTTQLSMESDFASAMPDKPEMTKAEKMYDNATKYILDITNRLGEGVAPPPELEAVRQSRDNQADEAEMAQKIYELMIEQGMVYDQHPETGILTPTMFDIKSNLDVPEVKTEFSYLYNYGMNLCFAGVLSVDVVKDIVKSRLIERTGLTPEAFDEWLGF